MQTAGGTRDQPTPKESTSTGCRYYLDRTLKAEIDLEALRAKRLHLFGVSNKLRPSAAAHAHFESGAVVGKVVVRM